MPRIFLFAGLILIATGLIVSTYDWQQQTIEIQQAYQEMCHPGSACPYIGVNLGHAYLIAGLSMAGAGIVLVVIYLLKRLGSVTPVRTR
jgi:hypothetical protein